MGLPREISVIPKESETRVLSIDEENGAHTKRMKISG